jgi:hypothetical protein
MMVTARAEWTVGTSGGRRGVDQALDDEDGRVMAGEAWETMTWAEKHDFLEKKADLLVLVYMRKEGALSQEYFEQRVAEVKAR